VLTDCEVFNPDRAVWFIYWFQRMLCGAGTRYECGIEEKNS